VEKNYCNLSSDFFESTWKKFDAEYRNYKAVIIIRQKERRFTSKAKVSLCGSFLLHKIKFPIESAII
jgi:hypothetical protein